MRELFPLFERREVSTQRATRRRRHRNSRRTRPGAPGARLLRLVAIGVALASDATAQVDGIGDPLDSGPAFQVSRFEVRYRDPHPDQPPLSSLLPLRVRLGTSATGLIAPHPERAATTVLVGAESEPLPYHSDAIGAVAAALLAALQERGLLGVYVQPDPRDLDVEIERDLRAPGDTVLRFVVATARVRQLRTIAVGDRVKDEWRIDNVIHDRIRKASPIQPTGADDEDSTDLVDGDQLDDYLFRLNRHPGRRVDAALAPAEGGGGVALDFLVQESKPWYAYAQVSNTGTEASNEWQQRFGVVHNQLLGRDDTLAFEYFRAGLEALNGFTLSYEAPWFDSTRPWWWNRPQDGPEWMSWLDRSKLPWWGNDDLRWRVWSSFTSYENDVDIGALGKEQIEGTDFMLGGRLIYNVFQHRAFFIDVFGGVEFRGVTIDNDATSTEARRFFTIPQLGISIERITPVSTLAGDFWVEGSASSKGDNDIDDQVAAGNDPSGGLDGLGRAGADGKWAVLRGEIVFSQFLEPLLNPSGWEDPSTAASSTLAHEISFGLRGQYAFDYRLVPQAEQVAGGLFSVRGYDQSAAVGDNVILGTFEYRWHLPHSLPISREPTQLPVVGNFRLSPQQVYGRPDWDFVIRAFVDAAYADSNDRIDPDLEPDEFLLGVGLGAEFSFRNNLRLRFDWGNAVLDNDSQTVRVDAGDQEFHLLFTVLY